MPRSLADIADEAILVGAGGRAILLQLANPGVGAGVARHSDFAERPLSRLHGTLSYLYAIVYGTDDDRAHVRRIVGGAHHGVRSEEDSELAYSAFDPRLQLWVAATIYDSTILTHELVFGPLDEESKDRIYHDSAIIGTALQLPDELWPPTRADFERYWQEQLPALTVSTEARHVSDALLGAEAAPLWLRAAMPLGRLMTAGLLPPALREPFGFRWTPSQQQRFDRTMRLLVAIYTRLPRRLRTALPGFYLRRLRSTHGEK